MKSALLFSGGKDSCLAGYLAKKQGHELICLITILSENKDSYMFHTPSIEKTKVQAYSMGLPLIIQKTEGKKEDELDDLEEAIAKAKREHQIEAVITGALYSVYQSSRIEKICEKLELECINPLWQMDQFEELELLIKEKFEVIIVGVAAESLDKSWLGRKIDRKFIEDVELLVEKYKINPAGEGGEFESFVLNCPLFSKPLKIVDKKISGEGNAWRIEVEVE